MEKASSSNLIQVGLDLLNPSTFCEYNALEPMQAALTPAPHIVDWKNKDSEFLGGNYELAKCAGVKDINNIIGKNDNDFVWGQNGYADLFREEDKVVLQGYLCFTLGCYHYIDKDRTVLVKKIPMIDKQKKIIGLLDYLVEILNPTLDNIILQVTSTGISLTNDLIEILKKYASDQQAYPFELSNREAECTYYLLRGKTAKETAKVLGISYRTVEDYLAQIKIKFGCQNKSELINELLNLNYYAMQPTSVILHKYSKKTLVIDKVSR